MLLEECYHCQMLELEQILPILKKIHHRIRSQICQAITARSTEELATVVSEELENSGDIVFAIDRIAEEELLEGLSREFACYEPVVLIAEGLPNGQVVLPSSASECECRWRLIVDPIDGTRPLVYQKRSGWILTAVAPNRGSETRLSEVELALQTEIPIKKQYLSDQLWALRGEGSLAERHNLLTGGQQPLKLSPSSVETIQFGYAAISRFFPGMRDVLASIEDELIQRTLGPQPPGGTLTFEDQYPSTAGQLYGLLSGADRFLADLRPLLRKIASDRGENLGHCCHPYDICTLLIAEESCVPIASPSGEPLDVPLDVTTDVAWVGYANQAIRQQVEPVLQAVLRERKLI